MKEQFDIRVQRSRLIPLKEADQHENAKQMAKDMMVVAEIYNLLANEQYGSRLYHTTIHLATNKILIYDISRQMKTPIAV